MDTFTARTPVDLLAVVPFVIGFHPEDSVVMLTFSERDRADTASFHARVDLPLVEDQQRQVAGLLREVATRHRARTVGLILYTDDVAAARLFADLLVPALVDDDIEVIDVIRVDGERFYTVDDDDHGTSYDLASHPFTASQVLLGRVAHESRAALRDTLVGQDDEEADEIAACANDVVDNLIDVARGSGALSALMVEEARWVQSTVRSLVASGARVTAQDAGRLLVLTSFEALREVAWSEMSRSNARRHVELWRGLTRQAPRDLRAGVSGLLGFAAWLAGDGALAWCALERCFEADPDDQLGHHVASLVESATAPAVWSPVPSDTLRIFQAETGSGSS